jgi:16S rRNA G1207 methylase RsmC
LDVLRPHAWQHVQYLPIQQQQQQQQQAGDESVLAAVCYQGQHVTAGQQVLLQLQASVDQLTLSLFNSSSSSSVAAASDGLCSLQQQVAQLSVQQQQQEGAGHILPYHLSMLNDHARTRAYDQGIAAAVQELLQQQQQQLQDGAAVVLDVGCGTGLLSMMAATAAAAAAAAAGNGDAVRTLQVVGK